MAENKTDEEVLKALEKAEALEFVQKLEEGIEYVLDNNASNLSGGQKQRISISRAFISNPKIMLLDDVTSALDNETENIVLNNLFNKIRIEKITAIIASQKIKAIKNADKIIVLNNGEIVNVGTHEELLKNCDVYKQIYDIQN